jgi:hypothetical protein
LDTQFRVDPSAREIVEDMDLMTGVGEMERGWPTDESVTTHYRYFHEMFPSAPIRCPASFRIVGVYDNCSKLA